MRALKYKLMEYIHGRMNVFAIKLLHMYYISISFWNKVVDQLTEIAIHTTSLQHCYKGRW